MSNSLKYVMALGFALTGAATAAACGSDRHEKASESVRPSVAADSVANWASAQSLVGAAQTVASTCAVTTLQPVASSNAAIERALTGTGTAGDPPPQAVAPMTRPLSAAAVCATTVGSPSTAAGIAVGLDAVVMASASADQCTLADSASSAAPKAIPTSQGPYTIAPGDWRDVLKVLYAGVHHDGKKDCNSEVRNALANSWSNLFEDPACGSGCTQLSHVFRPGDLSDTADVFLSLLGLPPTSENPFCNGWGATPAAPGDSDFLDNDPVRRDCSRAHVAPADVDQVCHARLVDGAWVADLGLVLPIVLPDLPAGTDAASLLYPQAECSGSFDLVEQPPGIPCATDTDPWGTKCWAPYYLNPDGTENFLCHSPRTNWGVIGGDGRSYNLQVRQPDGRLAYDAHGRPLVGAFYRLRSGGAANPAPNCTELSSDSQAWCLSKSVKCSLASATLSSAGSKLPYGSSPTGYARVDGAIPDVASLQSRAYPLTYKVYLNTVLGFGSLSGAEEALGVCWARSSLASSVDEHAGLVALPNGPACEDFDEQASCGAAVNVDACSYHAITSPACSIDVGKELFITKPVVVDHPVYTGFSSPIGTPGRGLFTLKSLFENLLQDPTQAADNVDDLVRQKFGNTFVDDVPVGCSNGQTAGPTPGLVGNGALLGLWPKTADGKLDLEQAPFRLLAIVNRLDLRSLAHGNAGEGRFVFGLTNLDTDRTPFARACSLPSGYCDFTFIFEYSLPAQTEQDVLAWAQRWHALGSLELGSDAYMAALADVVGHFTVLGAMPGGPLGGTALQHVRTRDPLGEMREFVPNAAGTFPFLAFSRPSRTPYFALAYPDDDHTCGFQELIDFINNNASAIERFDYELPLEIRDEYMDFADDLWEPPVDSQLRHTFAFNTCNGCHLSETPALGFQIAVRTSGQESSLSPFLTGRGRSQGAGDIQAVNLKIASTAPLRHFNDLERRAADLRSLVCGTPGASPSYGVQRVH